MDDAHEMILRCLFDLVEENNNDKVNLYFLSVMKFSKIRVTNIKICLRINQLLSNSCISQIKQISHQNPEEAVPLFGNLEFTLSQNYQASYYANAVISSFLQFPIIAQYLITQYLLRLIGSGLIPQLLNSQQRFSYYINIYLNGKKNRRRQPAQETAPKMCSLYGQKCLCHDRVSPSFLYALYYQVVPQEQQLSLVQSLNTRNQIWKKNKKSASEIQTQNRTSTRQKIKPTSSDHLETSAFDRDSLHELLLYVQQLHADDVILRQMLILNETIVLLGFITIC